MRLLVPQPSILVLTHFCAPAPSSAGVSDAWCGITGEFALSRPRHLRQTVAQWRKIRRLKGIAVPEPEKYQSIIGG